MVATLERHAASGELTREDVLETFSVYQPKTAVMVAEELGVTRRRAVELLDELAKRRLLTKARGSTKTPVWIRPHPN
jgi:predicted ArsR family transcriptional regulator